MKNLMIVLMFGMIVFEMSADMAVHDESVRQQVYLNAKSTIAEIKNNRKWLDLIIKHTGNSYNVANSLEQMAKQFKKDFGDLTKKIGDPKKIDTRVYSTPDAMVTKNLSLQKIRETAQSAKALKAYDSEKLYGGDDPELKYNNAEAAYINYENVLVANKATKRSLIAKRGALALSLKSVRSLAEIGKIQSALAIVNGKLDTVKEQEQQAHNKLVSIQIRNDQKEKLQTKAKSQKLQMDFFNTNIFANAQPFPNSKDK